MDTLEERLLLVKDQLTACERKLSESRIKASASAEVIHNLASEIQNLKLEILAFNEKIESFHSANPTGYQCRYCRSIKVKRVSGDPGDTGVEDTFFICQDCEKESVFTIRTLQ
jgi:hypothetical protein